MNLFVTGGAGFIGSNFIFYMLREHPEDRIVCLDKLTYAGNLSTLAPVMDDPRFRFCRVDICDREAVNRLFDEEQPDPTDVHHLDAVLSGYSSCRSYTASSAWMGAPLCPKHSTGRTSKR